MTNEQFFFPAGMDGVEVVARIEKCLNAHPINGDVWGDAGMDWGHYIYRICLEYGLHPIPVLVGLQRERSLLGEKADVKDWEFAEGVTGKDGPGMVNPVWAGLPTQILMSVRTMAWLAGIGPRSNFGYAERLYPSADRWNPAGFNRVQLYDKEGNPLEPLHLAETMAEYVQLKYTPHIEVLDVNEGIFKAHVAPFWE